MKSSSVSDLGKEWRDKVRHYCRTIKPYNRILYEEDFQDIFNIIESVVSQAEQRGYERAINELKKSEDVGIY